MTKEGTPIERQMAANQIREMREWERSGHAHADQWNRDVHEYLLRFDGLRGLFDYARKLDKGGRVLDIGTGKGKGISQLAASPLLKGLSFEATVLTGDDLEKTDKVRFHRTSAEELHGIEANSVSLILALNSIAYSAAPELVAESMDKVLVSGGAFKAVFRHAEDSHENDTRMSPESFVSVFSAKGYDLHVSNGQILLGVKPGREEGISAVELNTKDKWLPDVMMLIEAGAAA